jgi:hypothetical protein
MHDVETVVAVAAAIVTDVYATTGTIGHARIPFLLFPQAARGP